MTEYRYLAADEGSFPKVCGSCARTYADLNDFVDRTAPVADSSGLAEFQAGEGSNIVGVFRNCECGSTMLVICMDRRDLSAAGEERRRNFDKVLDYLEQRGIEREVARTELRLFMRGDPSPTLEKAGLCR